MVDCTKNSLNFPLKIGKIYQPTQFPSQFPSPNPPPISLGGGFSFPPKMFHNESEMKIMKDNFHSPISFTCLDHQCRNTGFGNGIIPVSGMPCYAIRESRNTGFGNAVIRLPYNELETTVLDYNIRLQYYMQVKFKS